MWFTRRPVISAILLSFGIYLFPLIGPHSLTFLGEALVQELSGRGERGVLWIASDIGIAVALQFGVFGVLYWFFRKPRALSGFILAAAVSVSIVIAQFGYLIAIPSVFLIEDDVTPESGAWPEVCNAQDAFIAGIAAPYDRSAAGDEVLVQSGEGRYQLLRIADCEIIPLPLPVPTLSPGGRVDFMLSLKYFVPEKALLFHKWITASGTMDWAVLRRDGTGPVPIEVMHPSAILSKDGEWIGWIQRNDAPNTPGSRMLIQRPSDSEVSREIDLGRSVERGIPTLLEFDVDAKRALLAIDNIFIIVDFAGDIVETIRPTGVTPQPQTFLKMSGGWVAWDAYQERSPYRVVWHLPAGSGSHSVLRGRNINAVRADSAGTLIAVSVTSGLNIGNIPDSVYVLRASDGKEMFRRYLPRYSRTQALFAGDDLFAYSSEGTTHVLRVAR